MFSIIYLEEKVLTRTAFQLAIEKQEDCKVIYSGDNIQDCIVFMQQQLHPPDLCIISDCYHYTELVKMINEIKSNNRHSFILLKSDEKFMKGICFLLKNGLDGIFFTDEAMIDLKKTVRNRTRYKLSADKLKLITSNMLGEFAIKELQYNTTPLTQNEIAFIQTCAKDLSYEQIAKALNKSLSTIYGYRDRVFKKIGRAHV